VAFRAARIIELDVWIVSCREMGKSTAPLFFPEPLGSVVLVSPELAKAMRIFTPPQRSIGSKWHGDTRKTRALVMTS
jgi:hypothetical protein